MWQRHLAVMRQVGRLQLSRLDRLRQPSSPQQLWRQRPDSSLWLRRLESHSHSAEKERDIELSLSLLFLGDAWVLGT